MEEKWLIPNESQNLEGWPSINWERPHLEMMDKI